MTGKTPFDCYVEQLLDKQFPKTDREWAAAREIERLREQLVNSDPFIVSAAIRTEDGVIHSMPAPNRHHHIIQATGYRHVQGFLTSKGTFATRIEAAAFALQRKQIDRLLLPPELYTEDLW